MDVTTASVPFTQPPSIFKLRRRMTWAPTLRTSASGSCSRYLRTVSLSDSLRGWPGWPWWSVSTASYTLSLPSILLMHWLLISSHSLRVLHMTTVRSSSRQSTLAGWSKLVRTSVTCCAHAYFVQDTAENGILASHCLSQQHDGER